MTYVRPLLEYCSSVWSPCTVTGVNKIESVQRQFTKKLPGLWDLSYDHRLSVLGLERLELRRLHFDLVWCFKIVKHLVDIPFDSLFVYSDVKSTRGHHLKLTLPDSRLNARSNQFAVRVVPHWNKLPDSIVSLHCLYKFKRAIKQTDFSDVLVGKS